MPAEKRRKWCDMPKHLSGKSFSPDHVYTFHIWQHLIDFSSYNLSVGGFVNLDLAAALNAQPLQLTCKDIKVGGRQRVCGRGFGCARMWTLGRGRRGRAAGGGPSTPSESTSCCALAAMWGRERWRVRRAAPARGLPKSARNLGSA